MHNILYSSSFSNLRGGGQRSLLSLLERLNREKYTPHLLCPQDGEFPQAAVRIGVKVHVVNLPSLKTLNFLKINATVRTLAQLIADNTISLIHTDGPRSTQYLGKVASRKGVPLVFHARVSSAEPWLLERRLWNYATRVIAVSRKCGERFKKFDHFEDKVALIHNAVDAGLFSPATDGSSFRRELSASAQDVIIGIIGQILPLKGQHRFLQAAAEVCQVCDSVRFVVIGNVVDLSYKNHLDTYTVKAGLNDKIVYMAHRPDMPAILSGLDILVNASAMEGFSRVILEAMACAKPVIATSVGGNPEAVQHNVTGLLVPLNNISALSNAIIDLVSSKSRRIALGNTARKRVEELFTLEVNTLKTEGVYEALLTDRRGRQLN